jgi:hypothetical protein
VYRFALGSDELNPGFGESRFAPFEDELGPLVPTLYAGEDETVALLESVFHEVGMVGERIVYERELRERGLAYLSTPRRLVLLDLRDAELARLGVRRDQLVSTDAAHYPCTREWAQWLHALAPGGTRADGIVWHSRKAELVPHSPPREAVLVFGDRLPASRGDFALVGPGVRNLVEGPGRLLVDQIAEDLGALVIAN